MFARIRNACLWACTIAIAGIIILFAIANREIAEFSLFPLPYVMALPKFLFVLILFVVGYVLATLITGMTVRRLKRELKIATRRIEALESELTVRRTEQAGALVPTSTDSSSHAA